jgi:hypothetical protein
LERVINWQGVELESVVVMETVILLLVSDIQILKESEEYCVNGLHTFWTELIMYETHALNLLEPIGNFMYHKV